MIIKRTYDGYLSKTGDSHILTVPSNIIKKYNLKRGHPIDITIQFKVKMPDKE